MKRPSDVTFQPYTGTTPRTDAGHVAADEPFRLLLLGDLSGRASRGVIEPLADRRPRRIDRDDLQATLADAELDLPTRLEGHRLRLSIRSLEDLHPDALWDRVDVFEELRSLRRRLSDPHTFAEAARELRGSSSPTPETKPAAAPEPFADGGALEAALAETVAAGDRRATTLVDAILRDLVVPRIPATPGQAELIESVDHAAAEEMRTLLTTPSLRRLESTWRAIEMLLRRSETDGKLQLWVFDVTPEELVRDLVDHSEPRDCELWRALFERDDAQDGPRWAAWCPLELTFGGGAKQAGLLARIARLSAAASTSMLAAASEEVAGCASIAAAPDPDDWAALSPEAESAWTALRHLPEASWILLALPRLLLRAPYGARTQPTEHFRFEELRDPPDHEDFLWGTGALAPLIVLAREFASKGWSLTPEGRFEVDRLTAPVVETDGEARVQPCAEALLSERTGERLRSLGITPLSTVRDSDRVRVGPLRSLAGAPLAGRWSS